MAGIYDNDGKTRLTASPGTGFCGLYAPDGSYYYTLAPGSGFCGSMAPDGSWYVTDASGAGFGGLYAPNGSLRITTLNEWNGALRVSGSFGPTVGANFVQSTYALNLAALSSVATFSRAGNAMQFDSLGYLTYAPNNLLTYSNTFSNAAWAKSSITVAGGVSDPLGGTSASTVTATAAGSSIVFQQFTTQVGVNYLNSVWLRRRTGTGQIYIRTINNVNVPVTLTGSWQQFSTVNAATGTTGTAAVFVFANGDAVDVYAAGSSVVTYETTPRTQDQVITTSAAYYGPRFDYTYNGSSWVPAGLLVEGAATNLALQSNTLSNASWLRNLVSAPAQNVAGIDGTTSAWTVTASGAADTFLYQTGSFVGPTTYSGVFKAGTNNWVYIAANGGGAKRAYVFFDLTNGVVGSTIFRPDGAYAGTLTGYGMVPLGNGFYRCYMSVTGTTDTYFAFGLSDANENAATTSGRTVIMGELQAEAAASMSSITRTTTASVTRAAETVQLTGVALAALQGASGSLFIEHQAPSTVQSGSARLIGTTSSRAPLYVFSDTSVGTWNGSVTIQATIGSSGKFSTIARTAAAWSPAGRAVLANGGTIATDANTEFGGVSPAAAYLGSDTGTTNFTGGWYRSLAIYNSRLPDATLQSKSVVNAAY